MEESHMVSNIVFIFLLELLTLENKKCVVEVLEHVKYILLA